MQRNHFLLVIIAMLMLVALTGCNAVEGASEPSALDTGGGVLASDDGSETVAQENPGEVAGEPVTVLEGDCAYAGIGYWKNHPELWNTTTLTLGAQQYDAQRMLNILNTPPRGDVSYILAQQLIAAKLNRTDDQTAGEVIADADVWLAEHPIDSNPTDEARQTGVLLAEYLDDFNNGMLDPEGCGWMTADDGDDARVDDNLGDDDDVNDDDDELDDLDDDDADERDDDRGERADACSGANPHPHAITLAEVYGVSYGTIMDWFCRGYGFGEIELAYLLSEEVGLTVEEVFALRAEGMGWGNIRKALGAAPGLGNDRPGRGNDRDRNTPRGLENREGNNLPPGQANKNDR